MPHHKSCIKRVKTNELRRLRNRAAKSRLTTALKKVLQAPDKDTAVANLSYAVKIIDKSVKMGLIHQNNGSRKKSRIVKFVNSL